MRSCACWCVFHEFLCYKPLHCSLGSLECSLLGVKRHSESSHLVIDSRCPLLGGGWHILSDEPIQLRLDSLALGGNITSVAL